ncbi:MAG: polysaccharide biosynthesis C-terminal domain-containing protein, partial [Chloroflexi bacterium]|nr:polysaccharide biosynthesis C-terminal domain-containing protein [Chloroflexota bacterium]
IATDRQKAWMAGLSVTVALNIILNVVAAPYFQERYGNGGIGVALTTLGCELLLVVFGLWLMPKGVIDRALALTFLKVGVSVGAMAAVVLLVRWVGLSPIPTVFLGGASYALLAVATRAMPVSDLRFVISSVRQRFGKPTDMKFGQPEK